MRFLMLNWRDPKNPLAGGAERVTEGYLRALAERGHEVDWFAFHFPEASREEMIGPLHIVRGGGPGTAVAHAISWYRRQRPFDLVIDQHHGIPWLAPFWCRTRCVAYIHEVLGPIWESFYPWPISKAGQLQERWGHWFYRNVPFWTASRCTRDTLLAHGVKQITIIPYGVHTRALRELPPKPLKEPLRLVVVSRLAPNKRIDHALRACAELKQDQISFHLTIVGGGMDESKLKDLTQRLQLTESVTFTGPLSEKEKDETLSRAHLLLHTSQREGWGLNVIEANAMGTPAAVYPVAGLVESTLDNQTGIVAADETPNALARRITELLHHPGTYQRLRQAAWDRAQSLHWDRVLPQACDWLETQAKQAANPCR